MSYINRHDRQDSWHVDRPDGWIETDNGNWVLIESDELVATVFTYSDGDWGAVWNGPSGPRYLKARCDSVEEAQSLLEQAIKKGGKSPLWRPDDNQWTESKKGGYYRKVDGATVSVKQAKSGSWYAVGMGGMLGQGGHPIWFKTVEEAREAVNRFAACDSSVQFVGSGT
jgi:hypothetical protein